MLVKPQGTPGTIYKTTITINQGETMALAMQFLQSDGVTPINITGCTLKASIEFPSGMVEYTTGNGGIVITDSVNGKVVWNITSSQSATFPEGNNYPYDFWLVNGSSEVPYLQGIYIILPTVTPVP